MIKESKLPNDEQLKLPDDIRCIRTGSFTASCLSKHLDQEKSGHARRLPILVAVCFIESHCKETSNYYFFDIWDTGCVSVFSLTEYQY